MTARLLFCSGDFITAFLWSNHTFSDRKTFTADFDGRQALQQWLCEDHTLVSYLLVDLLEEEFHIDCIPRVWGRDKRALCTRLLNKYLPNTGWRFATIQDRQSHGRKDLNVLLTGIPHNKPLQQWLDVLQHSEVPLKGIYSLAMVGESLLKPLGLDKKRLLLITQQSPGSVRQSFYDHGRLKFSRLISPQLVGKQSCLNTEHIGEDIKKTLVYLRSQRVIEREDRVDICTILPDHLIDPESSTWRENTPVETSSIRLQQQAAMRKLAIKSDFSTNYNYLLFAHQVLNNQSIKNHYASDDDSAFYFSHCVRRRCYTAAFLVLVVGCFFSGKTYFDKKLLIDYAQRQAEQIVELEQQYEALQKQKASLYFRPDTIAASVKALKVVQSYVWQTPQSALIDMTATLEQHPLITPTTIRWLQVPHPTLPQITPSARPRSEFESAVGVDAHYPLLQVDGYIADTSANIRIAVDAFNAFVKSLQTSHRYRDIGVLKTPHNVDGDRAVSSNGGIHAANQNAVHPTFSLRLMPMGNVEFGGND